MLYSTRRGRSIVRLRMKNRVCAPEIQLLREKKRRMMYAREDGGTRFVQPSSRVAPQEQDFRSCPSNFIYDFAGTGVFRFPEEGAYDAQTPLLASIRQL